MSSGGNSTWYEKTAGAALFLGSIVTAAGLGIAVSGGAIGGIITASVGLGLATGAYLASRL